MAEAPEPFLQAAEALGIVFDPGDLDRFGRFLDLLLDANERFNLTAIRGRDAAWEKHVLDSLTLVPALAGCDARRVIDVGSGGGLPGIVLAIARPATRYTLLEATGKKARFLESTAGALGLDNVTVVNERAETAARDGAHREQYDAAVARAVGRLAVLLELAAAFPRPGGLVLAIKGRKAGEEITEADRALRLLHCEVIDTTRTTTGTVVAIEKLRVTPNRYPRRPGEPKRSPLGLQ